MRVTGVCNICGAGPKNTARALAECPHARRLWEEMRLVTVAELDRENREG
jgi:hypothetical protein